MRRAWEVAILLEETVKLLEEYANDPRAKSLVYRIRKLIR